MKIFFDTSSLIKLYFKEDETPVIEKIFLDNIVTEIFVSDLTKTEFFSAIYKKVRTKNLTLTDADSILSSFLTDQNKFSFIPVGSEIIDASQKFIVKYGINGLRALDAIQLASAYSVRNLITLAVVSDKLLNAFLKSEQIQTLEDAS